MTRALSQPNECQGVAQHAVLLLGEAVPLGQGQDELGGVVDVHGPFIFGDGCPVT